MFKKVIMISFYSIFGVGCATSFGVPYDAILENSSSGKITKAHVIFGDMVFPGGILRPGIATTTSHPSTPIPKVATIEWQSSDGVFHEKDVVVKSKLPRRSPGEYYKIFFRVTGDDVEVEIIASQYLNLP